MIREFFLEMPSWLRVEELGNFWLGRSEFLVRLPYVLLGAVDLLLIYFLVLRLFAKLRGKKLLAGITVYLMMFTPVYFDLSRFANNQIIYLTLFLTGWLAYASGKRWGLVLALVFLSLVAKPGLNNLSLSFWYFKDSDEGSSLLNPVEFIFLLVGLRFLLVDRRIDKNLRWYLLGLFLLGIPLPFLLVSVLGLFRIWQGKKVILALVLLLHLTFGMIFFDRYFVHTPKIMAEKWGYGIKEAIDYVNENGSFYKKVVISNLSLPASEYWDFYGNKRLSDKIEFRSSYWPKDRFLKNNLYVVSTWEVPLTDIFPNEARVLREIYYPDGKLAFRILETVGNEN